jgi:pimeloyl-ACP methyl ester carboxylesterase
MSVSTVIEHDGCRLAYQVLGEGPPVLLIQGVGVHGGGWRPQVEALERSYRCLSFDNRGMGKSQPPGTRLSVAGMAGDARALIDAEGWESAHLVGHSLGGLIAMQLALSAPGRVRSLSLLCTGARGSELVRLSWWAFRVGVRTRLGTRRQRRHAFLEIAMPPAVLAGADRDALAESLAPIYGYDLADQPWIAMKQAAATRAYDATPHLARLAGVPTLVVSAAQDRIAPPALGRALAAGIPGSRHVELPEAAHGLTVQCADRVNALLLEHLAEVEHGRRARTSPHAP